MNVPPQRITAILCIVFLLVVIQIHIKSNNLLSDLHFLTTNAALQQIPDHFESESSENYPKVNLLFPVTKKSRSSFLQDVNQSAIIHVAISNTTESTLIHTIVPTSDSRVNAIYTCGYDQVTEHNELLSNSSNQHYFLDDVFPDFKPKGRWTSSSNPTPNDILVYGMEGPCDLTNEETMFPGKILYHNGEPNYNIKTGDRSYQIGPATDDGSHIMRVPYVSLVLFLFFPEQQRQIILQQRPMSTKEHFLIYVASNCQHFRDDAFLQLSKIAPPAHQGGKCPKFPDKNLTVKADFANNYRFNYNQFQHYRFCLVMENTKMDGYVSEKILFAFMGGCIPIYWGSHEVSKIFNEKAFIYYDIENPKLALDKVHYLEQNDTAYAQVMSEPILANASIETFFSLNDRVGGGKLKQRIRSLLGLLD